MAITTIYDRDNNPIEREWADARECIATGEYFSHPIEPKVQSDYSELAPSDLTALKPTARVKK